MTAVSRKYDASDDTWKDISTSDPTLNTSNATTATTAASITQALTIGSNANRIVIAWVAAYDASLSTISSVTFGGTAMTQLVAATSATNIRAYIYYLVNPPAGSGDCVATWGASQTTLGINVADFYNVDTVHPFSSSSSTFSNGDSSLAV